ncbi:MAG TPA: YihY/virulence factor BrkB family protein, partial [Ilumatobacteraceae bacterium]|nr:YihY/virulence factor BrkB family protein [Ilumatobacteraceae bacterium]
MAVDTGPDPHGRLADSPTEIPRRGWKDVLQRVKAEAKDDHLSLLAAGAAFFGLLALVPAMVAVVSVYGLVANPASIDRQVSSALGAAPKEVREMIREQLTSIASGPSGGAWAALVVGVLVALWSASSGMSHLIEALNTAYDEEESRGFVKLRLTSLALTIGALLFVVFAVAVIAVLPAVFTRWNLGIAGRIGVEAARWVLLGVSMSVGLSVLYR